MTSFSRLTRKLSTLATLVAAPVLVGAGCTQDVEQQSDDVTDLAHSSVKNQAIGNCWVYAAVGWAESLHLRYTGVELDMSESYLSYWHWFEQIAGGAPGQPAIASLKNGNELATGGFWGVAAELMLRYGIMSEGSFIPEEAEAIRSARQRSAQDAIIASLKSGVLSDPAARRDPAVVRAELDKAWQLQGDVVALLDTVMGKGVERTLYAGPAPADDRIFLAQNLAVGHVDTAAGRKIITLADALGKAASSSDATTRRGTYTWDTKYYPSSKSARRSYLAEMQRAMHAGAPVLVSWLVDFNAMSGNAFKAPPATPGRQGGHLVLLEDYEINGVPGFGTLAAGELVTDKAALDAALSPEATLAFLRIKNSWGESLAPDNVEELAGYHDLYMDYLDGPIAECQAVGDDACGKTRDATPLRRMILPSAAFLEATNDTCDAGGYVDACSGDVLRWCNDNGRVERFDCAEGQWSCGFSSELGHADCIDPAASE